MLSLKIEQTQADKYAEKMWENVQSQLNRIIRNCGLKATKKRSQILLNTNELDFLKSINLEKKLKEILTANTEKLRATIDDFEPQMSENLKKVIYNVFINNIYSTNKFDGLKFVNDIGLQTCPYCNRAYIQSVSRRGVVRPQIDHFFPKDKYPYLGVSFYNLIPSCSICNGTTVKGNNDSYKDKLVSPYEMKNDNFKFSFDIKSIDNFPPKLVTKIDINDKYFKLEDFYKHHGDIVYELYSKLYNEDTKEHFDVLRKSLSGVGFDEAEIHKFITCGYKKNEDLHKRPLSKLIKDISEELNLL
ncbi:hypothetical protein CRV02_05675 [Arcobacter sp. CECT 8989]|uniref:hypothetical protein n=1 Tax=Arcobacter sp. CECT 8989 TaxID=2044509 RepID=UPI00100B8C01|nr:hypothetical protein [Arcobacter sp. CECT 8989]RXK02328.1 hypothetical protein CRV02_05675 [Arcobacter sp. CECT 8989]